jgi:hypothetical protein
VRCAANGYGFDTTSDEIPTQDLAGPGVQSKSPNLLMLSSSFVLLNARYGTSARVSPQAHCSFGELPRHARSDAADAMRNADLQRLLAISSARPESTRNLEATVQSLIGRLAEDEGEDITEVSDYWES